MDTVGKKYILYVSDSFVLFDGGRCFEKEVNIKRQTRQQKARKKVSTRFKLVTAHGTPISKGNCYYLQVPYPH